MYDVVQVLGSLIVLVPFAGVALGRLSAEGCAYLALNAAGSSVLAATAVVGQEWGFVLLEAVWALVSLWSLAARTLSPARGGAATGMGQAEPSPR